MPPTPLSSTSNIVAGVRIHGRVGPVNAPGAIPIVFVHGLGVSITTLEPTMRVLASEHPIAALDLPGFGRSGSAPATLTITELADTLVAWMNARGIGPALLVGNSFGCQVIVECALRNPSAVRALLLNAPTMDDGHRTVVGQLTRMLMDIPREPLSLYPYVARDYLRAGPARLLTTLLGALDDSIESKLPRVGIPVSVVIGEHDPIVTHAWGERLAQLTGSSLPDAAGGTVHTVAGAAHAMLYDNPREIAALIVALLARIK